jgi:hypothetical protein
MAGSEALLAKGHKAEKFHENTRATNIRRSRLAEDQQTVICSYFAKLETYVS